LRFDGKNWLEIALPPEFGTPYSAAVGSDQALWLANDKMIARYLPGGAPLPTAMPTPFPTSTPPVAIVTGTGRTEYLVGENISAVAFDPGGRPWVLARQSGQSELKVLQDDAWVTFTRENSDSLVEDSICLAIDNAGNAWVGTYKSGLLKFDGKNWTRYTTQNSGLLKDSVSALFVDRQGRLWVKYGYDPEASSPGVTVFDGTTWTSYTTANSGLLSNEVTTVAFDAENRAWIGGDSGISIYDGRRWTSYPAGKIGLVDGAVWSIAFDKDGRAWVGFSGDNQGVTIFDGINWKYMPPEEMGFTWHKNRQNNLLIDQLGRVWIWAYRELRVFDGAAWIGLNDSDPGLTNINDIGMDGQGSIWIANGDRNGLVKLSKDFPLGPAK
jgi:ligand-binding sensor domain-containing protein